jgi:hypothetical protein
MHKITRELEIASDLHKKPQKAVIAALLPHIMIIHRNGNPWKQRKEMNAVRQRNRRVQELQLSSNSGWSVHLRQVLMPARQLRS